jgi:hypothetical protein
MAMSTQDDHWRQREIAAERRTPGVTLLDVWTYNGADCLVLASALAEATGWPIHAYSNVAALHTFVVVPGGRHLDIEGFADAGEHATRWNAGVHRQLTADEVAAGLTLPDRPATQLARKWHLIHARPYSAPRARTLAETLTTPGKPTEPPSFQTIAPRSQQL